VGLDFVEDFAAIGTRDGMIVLVAVLVLGGADRTHEEGRGEGE
jgi:hypothetical protein